MNSKTPLPFMWRIIQPFFRFVKHFLKLFLHIFISHLDLTLSSPIFSGYFQYIHIFRCNLVDYELYGHNMSVEKWVCRFLLSLMSLLNEQSELCVFRCVGFGWRTFLILEESEMKCENYFCIYESNGDCTLKEISLNIMGACEDCIYPSIDREYLEKEKQILLEKFEHQKL